MSRMSVLFIKSSLIYFAIGSLLGVLMSFDPGYTGVLKPVHAHVMLLGWIIMMIYGVGYHILPRFSAKPLYSDKLSVFHYYLSHIGTIGLSISLGLRYYFDIGWTTLFWSAVLTMIAISLFIFNMFMTLPETPGKSK